MGNKINFDNDWLFHRGEIESDTPQYKGYMYMAAKTERGVIGPASRFYQIEKGDAIRHHCYDANCFSKVSIPHDYLAGDIPDKKYNEARGFVNYESAWYVKHFDLDKSYEGNRITLYFEGISGECEIYLNSCLIKRNYCGYVSFEVDITDVAFYGAQNVLSIHIDPHRNEGWWYEGAGITRHVWLNVNHPVSVDLWGVFAKPKKVSENEWEIETSADIRNDYYTDTDVDITASIWTLDGKEVAAASASGKIEKRSVKTFLYTFNVSNPELWSPENPSQYKLVTTCFKDGEKTDENTVLFGFRTFVCDPDKGLFINGKHYKIKGVCSHSYCGFTGKAIPDNIYRYQVELLKKMGANGYRTSHYPQAEAFMDELDKTGFIVLDETRWFESTQEGKENLKMLIKRDRNRPSVFFWCLGNEEVITADDRGARIAKNLVEYAHTLDDTRPVTFARSHFSENENFFDALDVVGINYILNRIDEIHASQPNKAFLSTECCALPATRGCYFSDNNLKGYKLAYDRTKADNIINSGFSSREGTWKCFMERDWVMGGYQWTAFEYRGEADKCWPRRYSQCGSIDAFLQKKDAFYQNKSHWSKSPMVHILPHWNFKGLEGTEIKVGIYTNTEKVELYLNGKLILSEETKPFTAIYKNIPFEAGTLLCKGYIGGVQVAEDKQITSGNPYRLKLVQDTMDIEANGKDLCIVSCLVEDEKGNPVPDASPLVNFETLGDCWVYSTGSDISEADTIFKSERKMRAGRIGIAVKLGKKTDNLKLIATADGLLSASVDIKVK